MTEHTKGLALAAVILVTMLGLPLYCSVRDWIERWRNPPLPINGRKERK